MGEKIYLAYFEAVTTNTPDCIEQHEHTPSSRVFTKRENDFYALDDKALKTALLRCEKPRSCVFLGDFEGEQINILERSLAGEIDSFNFPREWCCANFNRKHVRHLSESPVSVPLDDSPHLRRPFFCIVRHSDLGSIQDKAARQRFFDKLESKTSLLPKSEMSDDDPLPEALAEGRQRKTLESWFCRSCDFYALRKDSCRDITDMRSCNVEHWAYLRDNYRSFFLKFLELAENLKADPSQPKSSKKVTTTKSTKTAAPAPADKTIDEGDKRTPAMRRIQQEAEAIPLPDDKQSNNQWITASDLAKRIADEKRKTKNKKRVRQPADGAKPKTAHAIARDTLASERKIGKCISCACVMNCSRY